MNNILTVLNETPNAILIDSAEGSITYGQSITRIEKIIKVLTANEAKTVAILADNQPDWIFIDLACQIKSICLIPLPLFFSDQQLQHAMRSADVDLIFTDQLERITPLVVLKKNKTTLINSLHACKITHENISEKPEETNKITFTSGSTGDPKGVCLSTEQQWSVARSIADAVDMKPIRHLCILPLSTLLENIAGVYAPILAGGSIVLSPLEDLGFNGSAEFQLEKLLNTIECVQPNTIVLLPQLLLALVNAVESGWKAPVSLKFIAVGGGKVSPHLIVRARQYNLPVYEGYGLSECVSVVSLNTSANDKHGSVGKPLPHLKVVIKDNEIHVDGQNFLGYLNDSQSWHSSSIATGDLGHIDKEGYLYIDGRKKNILVSSFGRNINPEWVESEILSHPLIQQCVVLGDARPNCCALIFPRFTNMNDSSIQKLIDDTNQRLPDYARIHNWLRLEKPLSSNNGLLTGNGRPKRIQIAKCYQKEIENMYSNLKPYIKEPCV
jgi:long-subunit acyl-CoA synthetase (AMP-forming)